MRVRAHVTLTALAQGKELAAFLAGIGVRGVGIRAGGAKRAGGGLIGLTGSMREGYQDGGMAVCWGSESGVYLDWRRTGAFSSG